MPRGAAVLRYEGARGVVWRVKYADANGRQVMETVGAERDGVTRKEAEAELRERLVRVECKGYRGPQPVGFRDYAERWFQENEKRRQWKPATVRAYKFVRPRLVDAFGHMPLGSIRPGTSPRMLLRSSLARRRSAATSHSVTRFSTAP
jgi:hypothetical protein